MTGWSLASRLGVATVTSWICILPGYSTAVEYPDTPATAILRSDDETSESQYYLVIELQSHLQLPRLVLLAQDLSESWVGNIRIRSVENNIVKEVE